MIYLADVNSWVTGGETTPEEASSLFNFIYDGIKPMLFLVGMISDFGAALPDESGWLQCTGDVYESEDYPDLFDTIGTTYNIGGESAGQFRVPDLRGRTRATLNTGETRLPAWADDPGGVGGASNHMLTEAELPAHDHDDAGHDHSTHSHLEFLVVAPGELPASTPSVFTESTGTGNADIQDTGAGDPHNNVQPTMALFTYILAKL